MSRIWLCGMSGPGSLANLREMWEPIKHAFSGIVWVLHDSRDSEEAAYLEAAKGAGMVIHYHYHMRHNESRNQYLWCGPIQQGEWCVQLDDLERLNPAFVSQLPQLIERLEISGANATYFFGKVFMFRHHESLRYQGSPHEGFTRDDGQLRGVELNTLFPQEADARYNVRAQKRQDPLHWLFHYGRYYISMPWGSNHCLLGNENRGDPIAIYRQREAVRLQFREYLRAKGVPLTVDGFRDYLLANPRDPEIIRFCNLDKVTNDLYRHWVLKDLDISDNHHWRDLKVLA